MTIGPPGLDALANNAPFSCCSALGSCLLLTPPGARRPSPVARRPSLCPPSFHQARAQIPPEPPSSPSGSPFPFLLFPGPISLFSLSSFFSFSPSALYSVRSSISALHFLPPFPPSFPFYNIRRLRFSYDYNFGNYIPYLYIVGVYSVLLVTSATFLPPGQDTQGARVCVRESRKSRW